MPTIKLDSDLFQEKIYLNALIQRMDLHLTPFTSNHFSSPTQYNFDVPSLINDPKARIRLYYGKITVQYLPESKSLKFDEIPQDVPASVYNKLTSNVIQALINAIEDLFASYSNI